MSSVILDQLEGQLTVHDGLLHFTQQDAPTQLMPIKEIDQLVIGQDIALTGATIIKLAHQGVSLFALGSHNGAFVGSLVSPRDTLRLKQYQACVDEEHRTTLVKRLITARMRGQNRVLRRLAQPQLLPPTEQDWQINLMLLEAGIARVYWQRIAQALPNSGFQGRRRRPPTDPINALLSLVATLEDSILSKYLLAEGFDITLGLHHATGYRRYSLLLDIKELTRYQQENWILDLWLLNKLTANEFCTSTYGCRLTSEGQKIFYPEWHRWQRHRRAHLKRLVKLCRRLLEKEIANGK